jgi:hypothetical protein
MSYCRFQNTVSDLNDCRGWLEDNAQRVAERRELEDQIADLKQEPVTDGDLLEIENLECLLEDLNSEKLSKDEEYAKNQLIATCRQIISLVDGE